MITSIDELVSALREELQSYGEMLALLDRQKSHIMSRATAEVFQSISVVKAQSDAIQNARDARERCRRATAEEAEQSPEASFAELIPCLPGEYQPLLQALVDENNQLLGRIRQRARQNHLLLNRSLELMQSVINALFPPRPVSVYNGNGGVGGVGHEMQQLCNAVG